jgi:hypothetical protein
VAAGPPPPPHPPSQCSARRGGGYRNKFIPAPPTQKPDAASVSPIATREYGCVIPHDARTWLVEEMEEESIPARYATERRLP